MCDKTCPGHCCRCFILPYSIEQMKHRARQEFKRGWLEAAQETAFIADMVICLGTDPAKIENVPPLKEEYGKQGKLKGAKRQRYAFGNYGFYYTCRHYNTETHLCMVYEQRPEMCRKYPSNGFGHDCMFEGCGYDNSNEDEQYRRSVQRGLLHVLRKFESLKDGTYHEGLRKAFVLEEKEVGVAIRSEECDSVSPCAACEEQRDTDLCVIQEVKPDLDASHNGSMASEFAEVVGREQPASCSEC